MEYTFNEEGTRMELQSFWVTPTQVYGVASLIVPGLGHLLQRRLMRGLLWVGGAIALWVALILTAGDTAHTEVVWVLLVPAIALYHCVSMYAAMTLASAGEGVAARSVQELMPLSLWKQAVGGTLAVVAIIALVLWNGALIDHAFTAAHARFPIGLGWGRVISQMIVLWAIAFAGGWLFWTGRKESASDLRAFRERAIVAYALRNGGRITVPEASMAAHISLSEAQALLETLVQAGYAHRVDEQGIAIYRFSPMG
jgi:hypothetical protein